MLNGLTQRLIENEVKAFNDNLLIEGVMLTSNIASVNRYSLANLNECGDDELKCFKDKLVSVTFSDDMSIDDRKSCLLNAAKSKSCSINEASSIDDIDAKLKDYRKEYIDACKNKDNELKSKLISQIKDLEKIKNKKERN